jgi:DNA-binding response OmpR family regulator
MKVLIMENEPSLRQMLAYVLERRGVEVEQCTPEDLEERVENRAYDAIVFNARRRGAVRPAAELASRVAKGTRLVCFSAAGRDGDAVRPAEVDAHLPFPFSSSELLGALLGITR